MCPGMRLHICFKVVYLCPAGLCFFVFIPSEWRISMAHASLFAQKLWDDSESDFFSVHAR